MTKDRRRRIEILSAWNGAPLPCGAAACVDAWVNDQQLLLTWTMPFFGDPPPAAPAGFFEGLWNHEVFEFFIAGARGEYLELEFGPYGHWLALSFRSRRQRRGPVDLVEFRILERNLDTRRWRGRARVSEWWLPSGKLRCNAYVIHGGASARCYHAAFALSGENPDFHQVERFGPFD